ncbi:MAG: DUF2948 family protein [Alphaproteobacteria bacterium]|nr:DUF2948 family protein [Alphaproteobacteria bacterium]
MTGPLKLRADDADDLGIVSACLQDSIVPMAEVQFLPGEKRFAFVANRFRWENCRESADMPVVDPPAAPVADVAFAATCATYERVNCGVCFEGVERVRRRGFDVRDRGRVLELLAIEVEPGAVVLAFSGEAAIRLEGVRIWCHLSDIGEPWTTQWRPRHPSGDTL